jgi:acetyl-CoA acyltransferase
LVIPKGKHAFDRNAEIYDTTIGWRFVNHRIKQQFGVDSMPETAENLAAEFNISRQDQDTYAQRSQDRTRHALEAGYLRDEICPVSVAQKRGPELLVEQDEQPRPETTLDALAKLRPIVKPDGTVTAGNASGVNDGAAALLIASQQAVDRFGLTPRVRILGMSVAGVPPRIMGFGPAPASRRLLDRLGLTLDAVDVIELNEAFAAQVLTVLRDWDVADDDDRVNPNGGAIALGHPLGASGARLVIAATNELTRRGGRHALCTMCIGVGQGIAMVIETV